jgi:hypothetical protein
MRLYIFSGVYNRREEGRGISVVGGITFDSTPDTLHPYPGGAYLTIQKLDGT